MHVDGGLRIKKCQLARTCRIGVAVSRRDSARGLSQGVQNRLTDPGSARRRERSLSMPQRRLRPQLGDTEVPYFGKDPRRDMNGKAWIQKYTSHWGLSSLTIE